MFWFLRLSWITSIKIMYFTKMVKESLAVSHLSFSLLIKIGTKQHSNIEKRVNFWLLQFASPRFWAAESNTYTTICGNCYSIFCSCVPYHFSFVSRSAVGKGVPAKKKGLLLSILGVLFSQIFEKISLWLILYFTDMVKVFLVIACPINFSLL